jgi:hypothetical protein
MKALLRIAKIIITIILVIALLAGVWLLVSNYAAAIVLCLYALGSINSAWSIRGGEKKFQRDETFRWLQIQIAQVSHQSNWLSVVRGRLATTALFISFILVWPATIIAGFWSYSAEKKDANKSMYHSFLVTGDTVEVRIQILVLVMTLSVYVLSLFTSPPSYFTTTWLGTLLVYVILRLLYYLMNTTSLPAIIRRQSGNPVIKFFTITGALYIIWVLTFYGLTYGTNGIQTNMLAEVGVAIVESEPFAIWNTVQELLQNQHITLLELLRVFTGLLFFLTLLDAILHWGEFVRSDEDFRVIACKQLLLGRYNAALSWFDRIKLMTVNDLALKAGAYLGLNQIERAIDFLKRALSARGESESLENKAVIMLLSTSVNLLVPEPVIVKVIARYLKSDGPDWLLAMLAYTLVTQKCLREATLDHLLKNPDLDDKYPLTHATNLIIRKEYAEAANHLAPRTSSEPIEEIVRRVWILYAGSIPMENKEEGVQFLNGWAEENLDNITAFSKNLSDDDQRQTAVGLLRMVQVISQRFDAGYEEQCGYIINEISVSFTSDVAWRQVGALSEYLTQSGSFK